MGLATIGTRGESLLGVADDGDPYFDFEHDEYETTLVTAFARASCGRTPR